MQESEPRDGERGGHQIDDRLPAHREPRIYPCDGLPEGELEIEGAVYDHGQQHESECEGREVLH